MKAVHQFATYQTSGRGERMHANESEAWGCIAKLRNNNSHFIISNLYSNMHASAGLIQNFSAAGRRSRRVGVLAHTKGIVGFCGELW